MTSDYKRQLQQETLLHKKQQLAEQMQPLREQHNQNGYKKKNFIFRLLINTKNSIQNSVAFIFTLAFLVPLWIFKIFLNFFDLIERGVRFVIWLYVKGIVLVINFVYKLLQFFRITAAVNFFKKGVKTYLGNYSNPEIYEQQRQERFTGMQLIMGKNDHNLIDVKKVEKKIRTPNIFIAHEQTNKPTYLEGQREDYIERINEQLVPERTVHENIVQTSHRLKSPQLLTLSESHSRLKRNSTQPNLLSPTRMERSVDLSLNRQQTSPVKRMQPDRDISPQRYHRPSQQISQSSFKKKGTPQKHILLLHHHPLIHGSQTQKQLLQQQLLTLRTKMQELINENNKEINELEFWIRQKSQTIMMTRKQNLQLLNKIEELQRQNIIKNQKFTELQGKIREMQLVLQKEKNLKNGLNSQVEKLEQQIKTKTIEIMSLKEKIRKNFIHLQQMETIFGNEKFDIQNSPQKQEQFKDKQQQIEEQKNDLILEQDQKQRHSLKTDLNQIQVFDISNREIPVEKTQNISNIKEIGDLPDPKQITEIQQSLKTESEIQPTQKIFPEPNIEIISVKTTPAKQTQHQEPIEQKIKQQSQNTAKLVQQAEQFLLKEQQKLQKLNKSPSQLEKIIQLAQQIQNIQRQSKLEKTPQKIQEKQVKEQQKQMPQEEVNMGQGKKGNQEPQHENLNKKKKNKKKKR